MAAATAVFVLGLLAAGESAQLFQKFAWSAIDYAFPSEMQRQLALQDGFYIPENNLPVGIEVWKNKLFISVPRWTDKGVPSTLNYVPLDVAYTSSPKLNPYPDWATNEQGNCNGLTTTYRIRVDECDRLWVLDSGTVGIGNTTQQVCPYALHAFDLKTDRQILRYQFKDDDVNANTFIANIAVDVGKTCNDVHVYASDELGYGLLVYSLEQNDSWRFEHGFFHPDPLRGDFNIGGLNFQWEAEGIFGMALSPRGSADRFLFFHPLASNREFMVSTSVLKARPNSSSYHQFQALGERSSHSTSEVMTEDGIMFFNMIDDNAVGCWNWNSPYSAENQQIIAKDDIGLIFPSDVRVRYGHLWVISDRMPNHLIDRLDFENDVNFRVYMAPIQEVLKGTICEHKHVGPSPVLGHVDNSLIGNVGRHLGSVGPVRHPGPVGRVGSVGPYTPVSGLYPGFSRSVSPRPTLLSHVLPHMSHSYASFKK